MTQESFSRLHRRSPQQMWMTTRKGWMLSPAQSLSMIESGCESDSSAGEWSRRVSMAHCQVLAQANLFDGRETGQEVRVFSEQQHRR